MLATGEYEGEEVLSGISVKASPGEVSISMVGLLGEDELARLDEDEDFGRRLGVVLGESDRLIGAFEGEALALRACILALMDETLESGALTGDGDRDCVGVLSGVEGGEGSLITGEGCGEGSPPCSLISGETDASWMEAVSAGSLKDVFVALPITTSWTSTSSKVSLPASESVSLLSSFR